MLVYTGALAEDPDWSGVVVFLTWKIYQTYGETATLRTYYANMVSYLTHLSTEAQGNLLTFGLGDWLTPEKSRDAPLINSIAYQRLASAMAGIAGVLGHTADQQKYSNLVAAITTAVNNTYLNSDGNFGPAQGTNALALDAGIVPENNRASTTAALLNSIPANGGQFKAGEVTLPPSSLCCPVWGVTI